MVLLCGRRSTSLVRRSDRLSICPARAPKSKKAAAEKKQSRRECFPGQKSKRSESGRQRHDMSAPSRHSFLPSTTAARKAKETPCCSQSYCNSAAVRLMTNGANAVTGRHSQLIASCRWPTPRWQQRSQSPVCHTASSPAYVGFPPARLPSQPACCYTCRDAGH